MVPVPVHTHSLSALAPVKFTYKFNKEEKLSGSLNLFNNGFGYYKHNAFENFHDAALSKKTCLILTDNKSLKEVFESDSRQIDIGTIAGSIFLKTSTGKYVTELDNGLYIGGTGNKLFININPIANNIVELKTSKTSYVHIDKEYPYTARVSEEVLDGEDLERQQFEIDYKNGIACFKTKTAEGYRYLSYGSDQVVRAIGLELNDTIVNPYLFTIEFVSNSGIHYDFDAKTSEVKYHNELASFTDRSTVNIKEEQESDTNLLMSCATTAITSSEVPLNIAITKTNFSTSGSYSTKRTI